MSNPASSVASVIPNTTMTMVSNNKTNNVIDNVTKSKEVDLIADKLVLAFNNPGGREFYCKVGYKLSEYQIWNNLEQSSKGREPAKLFTWLCKRSMA